MIYVNMVVNVCPRCHRRMPFAWQGCDEGGYVRPDLSVLIVCLFVGSYGDAVVDTSTGEERKYEVCWQKFL